MSNHKARVYVSKPFHCFQTGTLTENEMKLWGILPCSEESIESASDGLYSFLILFWYIYKVIVRQMYSITMKTNMA